MDKHRAPATGAFRVILKDQRPCYFLPMLAKLDALLEKDGPMANAAGAAAAAIYSALAAGYVPAEHFEAAMVAAALLTLFAPAAKRRDILAKRKEAEDATQAAEEA